MNKHFTHYKFVRLGFILAMLFVVSESAFSTSYYFYVQFTDKNNSPYSLSNPSEFLSDRAIARRENQLISIDSTDLPVNPAYIDQIQQLGIPVHCRSKWMNGVTVKVSDSTLMALVRPLPFVKFVQYTGLLVGAPLAPAQRAKNQTNLNYGIANPQISLFNGKYLHDLGFTGKGIQIGVIDAGFTNVDINPAFDSLRLQGRLLGTKDIINPNSNIYTEDAHGAYVLSTMTGNLPGQFLGTAPDASYWLIRTEYGDTEYKVETDFWVSGIEFADSVGVDVVNSSLGYYTFDDPSMSFSYADMTGTVSRASRAATIAGKKGIIVVVSAGNEGSNTWHYIGSPADAEGIITVGGVLADSTSSSFSSFGPSYDGRIKPELCAVGTSSAIISTSGNPAYGNGTSFASPIMAGMMACFLQAAQHYRSLINIDTLLQDVFESGNLFATPTAQKGYGIPDFEKATQSLINVTSANPVDSSVSFNLAYNAQFQTIHVWFKNPKETMGRVIKIYSITGSLLLEKTMNETITNISVAKFPTGIYAINVSGNGKSETKKIVIR